MAGLLKNQILKHLSRFAKNLSSDQLQLSTFRGHCELHNLDLNEQVLTDLLELPSFLQLTKAVCSHVVVKIHWTKLKSVPISVCLDEVTIEIQTCTSTDRPGQAGNGQSSSGSTAGSMPVGGGGKYGFTNRVIDGMTVTANSVSVYFSSPVFQASFQLSRLVLESRSPSWKKADLRYCQVKHSDRGEVLLFKHLEWQMVRIEAKALKTASDGQKKDIPSFLETSTPLRLIISQAMCRITIKKKLSDSSVLASRVVLIMDDLLWVLTDVQLLAAIHFLRSLSQLMDNAKKDKATRQPHILADRLKSPQHSKTGNIGQSATALDKIFNQCNVKEPSYHLFCKRIDLHLCDDAKDGRSHHSNLKDGGTFQIGLCNLCFDYYPYSVPAKGREHWKGYREPSSGRSVWVQQLLNEYYERYSRKSVYQFTPTDSPRSSKIYNASLPPSSPPPNGRVNESAETNNSQYQQQQLLATCSVLRLSDFYIYQVTTSHTRKRKVRGRKKDNPETFLSSDKISLLLPDDMKAVHLEFTQYYLPPDQAHLFPVPPGNIYAHLGPLKLDVHHQTILWLNAFFLNFKKCLEPLIAKTSPSPPVNIRVEALMPQILVANTKLEDLEDVKDGDKMEELKEPRFLQVQASRVIATNCRLSGVDHQAASTRSDLAECLQTLSETGSLFEKYEQMQRDKKEDLDEKYFPWSSQHSIPIPKKLIDHAAGHDVMKDILSSGNANSISESINNVWSLHFDPLWADFISEEEGKKRRYPFIDAIPLTMWIMNSPQGEEITLGEADVYSLLQLQSTIKIQFDHWQYLFLMSALESSAELNLQLRQDTVLIMGGALNALKATCVSASFPSIEVSLILGKEMRQEANNESSLGNEEDSLCDSESPMQEERAMPFTQLTSASVPGSPANPPISGVTGDDNYTDGRDDYAAADVCSVRDKSPACSNCSRNCVLPKSCSDSIIDSSIQALTLDKQAEAIQKGYQTSSAAVKKGISSLVASIDSIMSNKTEQHHPAGVGVNILTPVVIEYHPDNVSVYDDDAASLRSDLSSDSDQFVQLGMDNFSSSFSTHEDSSAELFFHASLSSGGVNSAGGAPNTEVGVDIVSEVNENEDGADESILSSLQTASNSDKKLQILKVLTMKVAGIEMCQQSAGWKSDLVVQAQEVSTTEHSKITWNDFQNSFTSKPRGPKDDDDIQRNGDSSKISCQIRIHQNYIDAQNEKADPARVDVDKLVVNTVLDVRLKDIELAISKAMLPLVVELLEVESVSPKPLKGIVCIDNLKLQLLNEDLRKGSVVYKLLDVNPLFHIPKCCLERTIDGTVTLLPLSGVTSTVGQNSIETNQGLLRRRISSSSVSSIQLGTTPVAVASAMCQTEESERLQRNFEATLLDLDRIKRENNLLKARIDILMETSDEDDIRLELVKAHQRIELLENISLNKDRNNSLSDSRDAITKKPV